MRKQKLYTCSAIEQLINQTLQYGYELVEIVPGCLGYGYTVLIAPSENLINYVIKEVPINEWSSGHTIRKICTISKKMQKEIDDARGRELEEETTA